MKDLIPVLESLKINVAISLDDDYNATYSPAELGTLQIDDFLDLCRGYFTDTEITEIEDSGVPSVLDFLQNDAISPSIKDKAKMHLLSLKELHSPTALQFLETGFQDSSIVFKKYSDLEEGLMDSSKGTIWFIDKEINGRDVLPDIIPHLGENSLQGSDTIVVVFTSDDSLVELNTSWDKRYAFLVENLAMETEPAKRLAYSFFVVLKNEVCKYLGMNESAARNYLSNILISSMSGYCISGIIQEMHSRSEQSFKRLQDAAKDSNQFTFQNIQYNMVKEGEPNVYHALKSILDYMQELEYTIGSEQYSPYIMAMKRLSRISPQQDAEAVGAQALKDILRHYEWAQFQFIHRDTNNTFADIAHGDIFTLTCSAASDKCNPCIGVLITQPCDCILRKDGAQTKRNASYFTLVLFEEKHMYKEDLEQPDKKAAQKDKDNWKRNIRKLRDSAIILSKEEREDSILASYIDVSSPITAIQILPFILDMASLNEDGKAVMPDVVRLEQAISQNKTKNWKEYYPALKQKVEQHNAQIQLLFDKLGEDANEVVRSMYVIPFSKSENRFCIERVGHLEDNMSDLICYNYIAHTYRAGKNSLLSLNFDLENGEGDT